ncbi:MAG: cytochrome c [Pseudomonadales bacterium]|nr:cytochrome c [Pseudomonadales bacterium]MCP5356647.1 cytochrome c [Pseudomonadales bacterium]
MFTPELRTRLLTGLVCLLPLASTGLAAENTPHLGQAVSEDQLQGVDLIVMPDGSGLPPGAGTAAQGRALYAQQCAACHGAQGEGTPGVPALAGGSTTATPPLMTVGSYWPYATTVYDYVRRAMPPTAPKSLSDVEVYQVVAYVLHLNGLITEDFELNRNSLPAVVMPNRDGFVDRSQVQKASP